MIHGQVTNHKSVVNFSTDSISQRPFFPARHRDAMEEMRYARAHAATVELAAPAQGGQNDSGRERRFRSAVWVNICLCLLGLSYAARAPRRVAPPERW